MINNFDQLKSDEYELFLPTPMFSELTIERTLKAEFLYQDVLKIECDQPFFTHVEKTGAFLHVEEKTYSGSAFSVPYRVDTRHYEPSSLLEGALIFTYLGGETLIHVRITLEGPCVADPIDVSKGDKPLEEVAKPPFKAYSVRTGKKAFNLNEEATVVIINHQSYPIVVKVQGDHSDLIMEKSMMTVQDIGVLKVSLKQSWLDRYITRKFYKTPSVKRSLRLSVRHEKGAETLEVPLNYTSYAVPVDAKAITDEGTYKRRILGAQGRYNRYIINHKPGDLDKARQLVEDCMTYHRTLVDLRLFYILILLEQKKYQVVESQINDILKFSSYYLEDHFDEFIEIMNVLLQWLNGKDVSEAIGTWPMTYYRQIFRLRILTKKTQGLEAYEGLYLKGFKSTHFFAHVAGDMLRKPCLPSSPSKFYPALIRWAINKDVLKGLWLEYLEDHYHQVIRQKIINSYDAAQLYAIKSSEGLLRIFVAAAIEEEKYTDRDHAIFLEAIQRQVAIPDLQKNYVKASYKNRLPIIFDHLQPMAFYQDLSREESAYLLSQYLEDPMTDKGPHQLMMRTYRQFIESHAKSGYAKEEQALIAYDLSRKIIKCQWADLMSAYSDLDLHALGQDHRTLLGDLVNKGAESVGYSWLIDRLTPREILSLADPRTGSGFIDWLLESRKDEAFIAIGRQGLLRDYDDEQQLDWCHKMLATGHPYTGELAQHLYKQGRHTPALLEMMMATMVGTIEEEIALYDKALAEDVYSDTYVESLLYKGVLTRLCPDQIRRIYLNYRSAKKDPVVCRHMDHYFAARILIEEPYGYGSLIEVFEEDLSLEGDNKEKDSLNPVGLALMRLYQFYGDQRSVISRNLVKNAVKNGIIFPWFADLAKPYMKTGALRKAAFFSYNSKPWMEVALYYRSDDQETYSKLAMKHVFFGLYIGYVVAFYKDTIQYYYVETSKKGQKKITESGLYRHEDFITPLDAPNNYDVVNTVMMGFEMKDDASVEETLSDHIALRHYKKDAFELN